ncbi:hypothetical protein F5Y14DRAFT_423022 [Nemania sp. NC0429]|nr:hypothetical protein F5Y14DRAFT_423022 [Nemania sp. NC0429]
MPPSHMWIVYFVAVVDSAVLASSSVHNLHLQHEAGYSIRKRPISPPLVLTPSHVHLESQSSFHRPKAWKPIGHRACQGWYRIASSQLVAKFAYQRLKNEPVTQLFRRAATLARADLSLSLRPDCLSSAEGPDLPGTAVPWLCLVVRVTRDPLPRLLVSSESRAAHPTAAEPAVCRRHRHRRRPLELFEPCPTIRDFTPPPHLFTSSQPLSGGKRKL